MNILILQGSPRANGNTAWMAEEYRKAAEAAGHKVTLVVQKDDMQELYPLLAEAEVLVIASPVYYFTLSAQIQAPIQRMYAPFKPAKVKKMVLLLSSNSPNVYDGAIGQYKGMCTFFKFEDAGIVTAKADEQKTEATREKILELVKKL